MHDKADSVNAGIRHAFMTAVNFIISIPGRVAGALSSVFRPLISAGEAAVSFISGIVSRIQGLIGSINSSLGGIPGKILGFLGMEHGGIVGGMQDGGIAGAQGGGPRGRLTMVGEHGRELLRLPPGTQVHSNPDTERMMGQTGSGQKVIIEFRSGPHDFDRFITKTIQRIVKTQGGGDVQVAFGVT